jgi:hypothetical protein
MQELPHLSTAQTNTVKHSGCCSWGNSVCKYSVFGSSFTANKKAKQKKKKRSQIRPLFSFCGILIMRRRQEWKVVQKWHIVTVDIIIDERIEAGYEDIEEVLVNIIIEAAAAAVMV